MEISKTKPSKNIELIKDVGISMLITLIGIIIFSLVLTYTNISENYINPVTIAIVALSILVGSIIFSKKVKKNGLANGLLVSGIYIITIYLLSSLLNWNFSITLQSIIFVAVGLICGLIGGIIGVN